MSVENPFNNTQQASSEPVEQKPEQQTNESSDEEQLQQWTKDHPIAEVTPEDLFDWEPEIMKFEKMIAIFEAEYSLEELHTIIDLRPEDVATYPVREAAKAALGPIVRQLNSLISMRPSERDKLKEKYMRLSRAVGIINNNKVDHNR